MISKKICHQYKCSAARPSLNLQNAQTYGYFWGGQSLQNAPGYGSVVWTESSECGNIRKYGMQCGSMHAVRPSVVLILVLPRRSSQSSDSARILTYPPFGISRCKNQFMPISACTSRSGRSRGSSTASGLEGTSHCIRRFTRAGPFLLDAFLQWSGLVFNRLHCVLVSSSLLHSKSIISSASLSFSS